MEQIMWVFFLILLHIEKEYLSVFVLMRAGQDYDFQLIYMTK